jgi:hypothetical protein
MKMYNLNWTQADFFSNAEDEVALQHAVARYHAFVSQIFSCFITFMVLCSFLDLMSSSPASFFVPTLDIDLVWHTHQLMSDSYENDTMKYIHRFVDQSVSYLLLMLETY